MKTDRDVDAMTYEILTDETLAVKDKYYIRTKYPFCYCTDRMTKKQVENVAKSMRNLGFTVIGKTK
ncbi:MAG TPA: hypothetical protein DDW90_08200 [Cyanobacteria bacterium UBA9971]|nr:MAG: hypothetical protein UR95_C0010G0011 [Parcubacteria group bacterium GW2011_GWC1_36_108]HBG49465.1 hypothetical protein [Cyanobacteria bacterium UBA9971]HCR36140.1 hypothetical protein [Candidatus Woesebacteria bacterium]